MRSTTVGWLTSMVRVLPVTADHIRLNRDRPEARESTNHPIEPTNITPSNSPTKRANPTVARDRGDWGGDGTRGSPGIPKDYHSRVGPARGSLQIEPGRY